MMFDNFSYSDGDSEHMGYLLADLQYMQRAYPNMEW